MIEYLPSQTNVLAVRIAGRLSADELDAVADKVEASLAANEKTHVFVEVTDLDGFDPRALPNYLPRAAKMLGKLDRFGRIAIVSGVAWIRWATRVESALLPGISYEVFEPEERDRALAWVEGRVDTSHVPGLQFIETDQPNVFGFEIAGRIGADEMHRVAERINRLLDERPGQMRILGRFKHFDFPDIRGLDAEFLRMKMRALSRVERYAVVGGSAWLENWVRAVAPLLKLEVRCFPAEGEGDAWDWLGGQPKGEASATI